MRKCTSHVGLEKLTVSKLTITEDNIILQTPYAFME
jgi:hypothetical protein